ncbi:hypothetical protein M501DRAFT_106806 [Patellaria atrata CBS 101060]|uniref:Stress response protein NST1 n=1 Tax=Patellaria atrata CBS 101060 TaxID=1346257 RepID=A0A9P4SKN9_9PEZI|nr:hypothetical protein M501DRAFT_106806 [Patellaria atrata CBS 101060]
MANGTTPLENHRPSAANKKKSKKKKKGRTNPQNGYDNNVDISAPAPTASQVPPPPPPPPPPLSNAALRTVRGVNNSKDRIWNTSTQEERERIKEFWLSLGEDERKSLVKIEKEAVLRKMKEQQKHSCSCTVCGRKRTAIEEELEVLYDAYYEELEQYANRQGSDNGAPMLPPPRFGHLDRLPPSHLSNTRHPPHRRIQELPDDEEDEEEEDDLEEEDYSDEDDEEEYSEDEPEELPRGPAADFFNFGNSLTVKGGILTVADDLLKNDGKKFIEMMEQLAERRMQREEEAQYAAASLAHSNHAHGYHGQPPQPEDDEYDDEEEDEYDSQEDDEYDEDEMDSMTEEQRMEEGRRMFQIFAARMFEQRVLTAYREKVARERQQKLLEELDDESRLDAQREAKKARDAAKKKEKKAAQKAAKAEEKAKKDQEVERRAREQKAQEKKAREEAKKKEREEREAREREARERKAQEERGRREREAKAKVEKEARDRTRKEEEAARAAQAALQSSQPAPQVMKRPSQPTAVALPPGLLSKQSSASLASPLVQVATPAIPKAPTPVRPRQSSQQGSHGSSPKTPQLAPGTGKSTPPSAVPSTQASHIVPKAILKPPSHQPGPPLQHPQPSSPLPPMYPPPGMHMPPNSFGFPPGINGFSHSQGPQMQGMSQRGPLGHDMPMFHPNPLGNAQYRGFPAPNGLPGPPPGMNGLGMMPQGRGFPMGAPPGFQPIPPIGAGNQMPPFGVARDGIAAHSRQQSGSYEKNPFDSIPPSQPIARPAPIQRPASVKPFEGNLEDRRSSDKDIDDLSKHLGSSALLDDTDEPYPVSNAENRRNSVAPGQPRHSSLPFGTSSAFPGPPNTRLDTFGLGVSGVPGNSWNPTPFGSSNGPWGTSPSAGWASSSFGMGPTQHRASVSRPVTLRLMVCQACKHLTAIQNGSEGFHDVQSILQQLDVYRHHDLFRSVGDTPITVEEVEAITETEGDSQNGGGSFIVRKEEPNRKLVKWQPEDGTMHSRLAAAAGLGEIGSPVPVHSTPAYGTRGFNAFASPNF